MRCATIKFFSASEATGGYGMSNEIQLIGDWMVTFITLFFVKQYMSGGTISLKLRLFVEYGGSLEG